MMKKILICVFCLIQLAFSYCFASDKAIEVARKSWQGTEDFVFVDKTGREVVFRGFNVSSKVKHVESGFKPFMSVQDAANSFEILKNQMGINMVRFTISWEGVNPEVDVIDYGYLADVLAQMREAIKRDIYILVDYHSDLFSRHLFTEQSQYTGGGAPSWIVPKELYPKEHCVPFCPSWGTNMMLNTTIRKAYSNFWHNISVPTKNGERHMQDAFLDQYKAALTFLKENMTPEELDYIVGFDPWNEPVDGPHKGLDSLEFENQLLWPFYQKTRQVMDEVGLQDKYVFAEPLVFWNSPFIGSGSKPAIAWKGKGYVFNAHYYDVMRMAGTSLTKVKSTDYLGKMEAIRTRARAAGFAPFVSEFGMSVKGKGFTEPVPMLKGQYLALDLGGDDKTASEGYNSFYSQVLSATEWAFDYYYDNHHEYHNGNLQIPLIGEDAWNHEAFSIVRNYGREYNLDSRLFERAYPRRSQGRILSFYYNDLSHNQVGEVMKWASIKPEPNGPEYLRDHSFALLVWQGRFSEEASEIYLPRSFDPAHTSVLVDEGSFKITPDVAGLYGQAGNVLSVLTPKSSDATNSDIHFALAINESNLAIRAVSDDEKSAILKGLINRLKQEHKGAIYLKAAPRK